MNQKELDLDAFAWPPLSAGFDGLAAEENGALSAWHLEHSLLHNPTHNHPGDLKPSDLLRRRRSELELRRLEGLAQAVAEQKKKQARAQADADQRAQVQHHSTRAADQPRPEISAGHALASIALTPRLLAQRPFIARVGARASLHALI